MSAPAAPIAVAVPAADTVPTPVTETPAALPAATTAADESVAPAVPEKDTPATEAAPAVVAADAAPAAAAASAETETKPVEPVTEGHLGYKAPGLLKQFTFAKKDFWFSDEPVSPEHLNLYLRGEKAEISHPVVAWASQTGKGLLFFVKKSETAKTHPAGVLALYDATDLKKTSPHEFTFRLHHQNHSFKASSDAERDGWYISIEKAIEIGKAQKDTVRESEGYKAELAKLNTPHTPVVAAGTATTAADKPAEVEDDAKRVNSSEGEELKKKNYKSRSSSRGFVNRLMGKKDELENKAEHKKEEKKLEKEEKKIEKEEKKSAEAAAVEPAPVAVAAAAPVETKKDEPADAAAVAEEKPRANKRNSIFGSLKASLKSPTKEKEQKDAELKSDAAAKDTIVSDVPPQLPETTTTTTSETTAVPAITSTEPTVVPATETKAEEDKAAAEIISTPNREKKNFLSGLSFINKRDRSVSPSAAAATTTTTTAAETDATKPVETSTETPAAATTTTAAAAPATTATTEEKTEETTPVANKRQSVLGGLGRRASKMIQRVQPSKKENAAPATAAGAATTETKTDAPAAAAASEETAVTEVNPIAPETVAAPAPVTAVDETATETKPAPVTSSAPPAVTASA